MGESLADGGGTAGQKSTGPAKGLSNLMIFCRWTSVTSDRDECSHVTQAVNDVQAKGTPDAWGHTHEKNTLHRKRH